MSSVSSVLFNIPAMIGHSQLRMHNRDAERAIQRMSTGMRINSAADDPLGNSISEDMRSQLRGMAQAQRNASEGASLLQVAEGSCAEITAVLQRMRELAVQCSNDTLSSAERNYLDNEFVGLRHEIARIAISSEFNGKNLLEGGLDSFSNPDQPGVLQIGANDQEYEDFLRVEIMPITVGSLGIEATGITTQASAAMAIDDLDAAIRSVSSVRSNLGALVNRLDNTTQMLMARSSDLQKAESDIRDTDYAMEATALSVKQILQQSSIAMLAQANSQPQSVLALFNK